MTELYIVPAVLVVGVLFYLFLISPCTRRNTDIENLKGLYIAHRGLHDEYIPENSLSAFNAAISGGYAIEIDIHITKDDQVVVFHDNTLKRMCGIDKAVEDMTLDELKKLRLLNTDCTIPTLSECLATVCGRVPLLVEFKAESMTVCKRLCQKANEILSQYTGVYFIQSFFPFVLYWYKKNAPRVLRGQLSTNFKSDAFYKRLLSSLVTNFIARPHFISYEHKYFKKFVLKVIKAMGGTLICWTLKNEKQLKNAKKHFAAYIFENFIP